MFFETIRSEGLAHNSYLIGDAGQAAVVDPSRDVDRYVEAAKAKGAKITLIFETHRNEDYISGASELAAQTGATVWRGGSPDYTVPYAQTAEEAQSFTLGQVRLWTLSTPGHTDDSISIAFAHLETGESPLGVFTGDALFVADVGRTDFYPDRREEVAGLLFESLHGKLLPLGDQTIIYPAHGAGSVCGAGMAQREASTIGYERLHNKRLQLDRSAFIAAKVAEHHYYPPYFHRMEAANQGDHPELPALPACWPLTVKEVAAAIEDGAQLLDLRSDQAISGAYLPGAFAVPIDMLSSFGGWFLSYDWPIVLVLDGADDRERALRLLVRIGYDRIEGFLTKGFDAWSVAAKPVAPIPGVDVHELRRRLQSADAPHTLDVRDDYEFANGHIDGAQHVYVGQIELRLNEIPQGPIVTYCASGRRALVAAAALARLGRQNVSVCWGSMKAWKAAGYPVTPAKDA
ncbi:MAG: rhodanese-like domain-containing protein [Pseudomonadota bacterium]